MSERKSKIDWDRVDDMTLALKSREYTEKLPGAPDGKYVVIQYDTVFEKKASAIETVTPMAEADGKWRVSGYYIR
jgi:Protein of unknown function (DUF4019)